MPKWRGTTYLALACLLALSAACAWAGAAVFGPDDWQYKDLDALARAGLLSGHPKGTLSDWAGQRLTRFEAASLTLRAVEGLGKAYQQQGQALQQMAQAPAEAQPQPAVQATIEDVARVEKLIEEFRAELVTMGARVDDLAKALEDVQTRLAKVEAERKQHQIDGYMQLRFRDDKATQGRKEFMVRTARVNLRGSLSERVSYRVEMQFDSKEQGLGPGSRAQLRNAYIDYRTGLASRLRMGQAVLPWGYELEVPTPDLWSGERSFFMDRLFPDQRDLGLQFEYQRSPNLPKYDVASVNGAGIDTTDNNNNQNLLGRVDLPFKNGSVALSGYTGTNGEGAARTRQDRDGLSARYLWGATQFVGEFVTGSDRGHDVRGWYGQVGHPLSGKRSDLLFAKYDVFDENRIASDDLFRRWSLGYWYDLDKTTRLTFAWELRSVEPRFSESTKWNGNAAWVQLQVKY